MAAYRAKLAERETREFGKAFEVDEARYVEWASKNQPESVLPRFTAWDDFKFSVGGCLALLSPLLLVALIGLIIWDLLL